MESRRFPSPPASPGPADGSERQRLAGRGLGQSIVSTSVLCSLTCAGSSSYCTEQRASSCSGCLGGGDGGLTQSSNELISEGGSPGGDCNCAPSGLSASPPVYGVAIDGVRGTLFPPDTLRAAQSVSACPPATTPVSSGYIVSTTRTCVDPLPVTTPAQLCSVLCLHSSPLPDHALQVTSALAVLGSGNPVR